jgi:heat shock protein HslJ
MTLVTGMRRIVARALLAAAVLIAAAPAMAGDLSDLLRGGVWRMEGSADAPNLSFEDAERVGGDTGCNRFGGGYRIEAGRIIAPALVSTKRACLDPAANALEQRFTALLTAGPRIVLEGDRLMLEAPDGAAMTFLRVRD